MAEIKSKDYEIVTGHSDLDLKIRNDNNEEIDQHSSDDLQESGDSEYDTDLDIVPQKQNSKGDFYYENDDYIGRNHYLTACQQCDNVAPQQRFLKEMESKTVCLSNRSLGPALTKPLCIGLVDNLRVENLLLDGADIGDLGGQYISELLMDNMVITRLNISGNNLSLEAAKWLSTALSSTKTLHRLNLSDNKFGDNSAFYLSRGISKNKSVLYLDMSKNQFAEESGTLFGSAIAENNRIEELDVSWNQIRQKGAVGIFKGLAVNSKITSFRISWNGLGYEGTVAISKALKDNTVLQELDISNNRINWRGAINMAKGLKKNKSLQVLKIGYNPLTTTGAMDIMQAVSETTNAIRFLDMLNVPVLGDTELLALTIQRYRKFRFIHGGVVRTPDKLGERKERQITSMERVIEYMKKLGIRPIELLRAFDKSVMFNLSKNEFISRLKKCGIPLHRFEMEALASSIAERDVNERTISYNKLVEAVNDQVLNERLYKIRKRNERIKLMKYHKQIMSVPLPTDTGSDSEKNEVPPSITSSRTSMHALKSEHKLPPIPNLDANKVQAPPPPPARPVKIVSMCAPLDKSTQKKKVRVKRKRRKREKEIASWMATKVA